MSRFFTNVRGKRHEWSLHVPERAVEEMREDGFEVFEEVNRIPMWVVDAGLMVPWVWAQDVFNWPSRAWRRLRGKK